MPIVIISRLPGTGGETIARQVAAELGYRSIDSEVFEEASRMSTIPAEKLRTALEQPPSMFGATSADGRRFAAYIRAALAAQLIEDKVVYHGPFGHVLITGIAHMVKVRLTALMADRIKRLMERENRDQRAAERKITQMDKNRLQIAEMLFGADDDDPGPFNLVLNTSEMDEPGLIAAICETVRHDRYRPTTYSLDAMIDLELSARLKAILLDIDPEAQIYAKRGDVRIRTGIGGRSKEKKLNDIRQRVEAQEGVGSVTIESVAPGRDQIDRRLH